MKKRLNRSMPSAAMVVALLAFGIAIGGGATAAVTKLKKNAVKTKNIKNKAVTTGKLADKAVTSDKLADKAVTSAKLADGAVSAANLAPCKAGTTLIIGKCFDTAPRAAASFFTANDTCATDGGRLPGTSEILATRNQAGFDLGAVGNESSHWTGDISGNADGTTVGDLNSVSVPVGLNDSHNYRCVFERG